MIKFEHKASDPLKTSLDALYVYTVEGEELDDRYGELAPSVKAAVTRGDFKGKARQLQVFYTAEGSKADRLALIGVGRRARGLCRESLRRATAKVYESARELKANHVGIAFDHVKLEAGDAAAAAAIAEAIVLSSYRFTEHKTSQDGRRKGMRKRRSEAEPKLTVTIFSKSRAVKQAMLDAATVARASNITRFISDQPGNIATPTYLAEESKKLGKEYGFSVKVLEEADMREEGMGALLGVAAGSVEPAKLIIMEHKPRKVAGKLETICLVGKGLTFDAGGISIKPADKMWEMKYDKCGGTAVIGAMCAISALNLPFHVYGLVPASENLPDGAATKPGDIHTSLTGHTIEVLNTDAEGRLILADALGYAHRLKPDLVVDFATLTGACVVALASVRAGVMGDEATCQALRAAGDETGEKVWHLPLDQEYHDMLKSDHADLKNIGGRWGGAITAGCFLSNFVPPEATWAHIDIAGPAWKMEGGGKEYIRRGASGFGVRLITEFLSRRA